MLGQLVPKASREASYFIGEKASNNGVVVECNWHKFDNITQTIVDFAERKTVYVLRTCFQRRENPETRSQSFKDERPYEVFENVNYNTDHSSENIVSKLVARNQKKFECFNMGNDVFALKTICVFEPGFRRCYVDVIGEVECSEEVRADVLLPNVTFDCYVQFTFTSSLKADVHRKEPYPVKFSLYQIDQVNPDQFEFAGNAPWNKVQKCSMFAAEDPFGDNSFQDPEKLVNVPGISAYALSDTTVYVPSKPRWLVNLALKRLNSLVSTDSKEIRPYIAITVDLRYNFFLKCFVVYEATVRHEVSLNASPTKMPLEHLVTLTQLPDIPGYFTFSPFSLVFDKYGLLSNLYGVSTVVATSAIITPFFEERCYTQLVVNDTKEANYYDVYGKKFSALCIDKGEFFSPFLHYLALKLSENAEYTPRIGAWYTVCIQKEIYENDAYVAIVTATLDTSKPAVPVKNQKEFWITSEWFSVHGFGFLFNRDLGPIGITDLQLNKNNEIRSTANCVINFAPSGSSPNDRPHCRPQLLRSYKIKAQPAIYEFK